MSVAAEGDAWEAHLAAAYDFFRRKKEKKKKAVPNLLLRMH